MYVYFALLIFRFETTSDFKPSALCQVTAVWATKRRGKRRRRRTIVCTIRARHQFLVSPLERKPRLQITLFRRGKIQGATDDRDDAIREPKALVKRLAVGQHRIERVPAFLGRCDDKLFHFFELMDAEDTPHITTGRTGFFSETGRVTSIVNRELCFGVFEPFVGVEGRDGLFRGGDEVLFIFVGDDLCACDAIASDVFCKEGDAWARTL